MFSGTTAFTSSEQLGNNANSWPKPTTISWPWLYKCIWPALIPTRQRRQRRRRHCNFPIESYSAKYSSTTCTVYVFIKQDYLANRNKLEILLSFSVWNKQSYLCIWNVFFFIIIIAQWYTSSFFKSNALSFYNLKSNSKSILILIRILNCNLDSNHTNFVSPDLKLHNWKH